MDESLVSLLDLLSVPRVSWVSQVCPHFRAEVGDEELDEPESAKNGDVECLILIVDHDHESKREVDECSRGIQR